MKKYKNKLTTLLIAGSAGMAGALAVTAYIYRIRPWHLSWGATTLEVLQPMPGDGLIPSPYSLSTRAISIQAAASEIWPWLIQIGYQRAGWYSYDALERIVGVANFIDGASSRRIIPTLQDLTIGDPVFTDPGGGFTVTAIEKERSIVLRARIGIDGHHYPLEGNLPANVFDTSWSFLLIPYNQKLTRLVFRFRSKYQPGYLARSFDKLLLEPIIFIMEQKMLRGIKVRVQQIINQ